MSADKITASLLEREKLDSTGIENGIAIPHAKVEEINIPIIAIGRSLKGVDFGAHDKMPTKLFFVILAPAHASSEHIKVLARLAKLLQHKGLKEKLLEAFDKEGIYNAMMEVDRKC